MGRPPTMPPKRRYTFGVAGDFIDFMEERDSQRREAVNRWRSIKRLYRAYRWWGKLSGSKSGQTTTILVRLSHDETTGQAKEG